MPPSGNKMGNPLQKQRDITYLDEDSGLGNRKRIVANGCKTCRVIHLGVDHPKTQSQWKVWSVYPSVNGTVCSIYIVILSDSPFKAAVFKLSEHSALRLKFRRGCFSSTSVIQSFSQRDRWRVFGDKPKPPMATPVTFVILQPPICSLVRRVLRLRLEDRRRDKRGSVIKKGISAPSPTKLAPKHANEFEPVPCRDIA